MASLPNPISPIGAHDRAIARKNRLTALALLAVIAAMIAISVVARHHMFPALFQGIL